MINKTTHKKVSKRLELNGNDKKIYTLNEFMTLLSEQLTGVIEPVIFIADESYDPYDDIYYGGTTEWQSSVELSSCYIDIHLEGWMPMTEKELEAAAKKKEKALLAKAKTAQNKKLKEEEANKLILKKAKEVMLKHPELIIDFANNE